MRIQTKVEPIDRDIELIFAQDLSPQARSTKLAAFARESLAQAEQQNERVLGHVPPHETFVDGSPGRPIDAVAPDGAVVFEFELLTDLFAWVHEQLITHSPVLSGHYSQSHRFYADGAEVNIDEQAPQANEYVFVNVQPYARKIERGQSPSAPEGVYEAVATLARQRFGNVARIRFEYRVPVGGSTPLDAWANRTRQGRRQRKQRSSEWSRRQPAIVITVK
jgi:hypothetical protein